MALIAGIVAFLTVGFLGAPLSSAIERSYGIPEPLVLAVILVFTTGSTVIVLRLVRPSTEKDPVPEEDEPWAIGEGRGAAELAHFTLWFVVTNAVAVYFFYPVIPSNLPHVLLTLAAVAAGLFVQVPVRSWPWPPKLPSLNPPLKIQAFGKQTSSKEPADALSLRFTFRFDHTGSLGGHHRNLNCHTIALKVCRSEHRRLLNGHHPQPDENADELAVLTKYVCEGLNDDLQRCAGLLWAKAKRLNLHALGTIQLVLAFTRDAIEAQSQRQPDSQPRYAQYPLETLVGKCGTSLDRTILTTSLLHLLNVKPLLVVSQMKNQLPSVGLAMQSSENIRLPSSEMLHFEDRSYYYCQWHDDGTWRFGRPPRKPKVIPSSEPTK